MMENTGLLYSLGISIVGVFLLCTERMPMFNKVLQIVPMPDPRFTRILTGLLTLEVLGAFAWDQLCLLVFAPKIFVASMRALTFKDVRQLLKMTIVSLPIHHLLPGQHGLRRDRAPPAHAGGAARRCRRRGDQQLEQQQGTDRRGTAS
jgi:cation-transporting ATPase 13A1